MHVPERPGGEAPVDEMMSLSLGRALRNHWKFLVAFFLLACAITAIVSLLLPKEYEATASVLQPPEGKGGKALEAFLGQAAGSALGALLQGPTSSKEMFLGILKSRTMQDDVIKKFNLVKVYEVDGSEAPMRDARKELERMTDIKASKEGVISVTVWAYDPQSAADMANFFMENLDRLNTSLNVTEGGQNRVFLDTRVAEAERALRKAEDRLRAYQSESKVAVIEGQAKVAIEGVAVLEGQILAAEVQLKTLETYSTPRNPDVIKLKESIAEMRRQLKRMEYGKDLPQHGKISTGGAVSDFGVSLGSIPGMGIELVRLMREAKIQETIYGLLIQQLEQAKIAEARDTPTVKILDRAVPPEWKSRPRILLNTAIAGFIAIILGASVVFLWEDARARRLRKSPRHA